MARRSQRSKSLSDVERKRLLEQLAQLRADLNRHSAALTISQTDYQAIDRLTAAVWRAEKDLGAVEVPGHGTR